MRVLTVRQPWAAAFFVAPSRAKDIENRTWRPPELGRIAIHSAQRVDEAAVEWLGEPPALPRRLGVVLGTVEVTSAHPAGSAECHALRCSSDPWAMWPPAGDGATLWHWHVEHARAFRDPIPARGRLGLWEPGPSVAHLIRIAEVEP